MTIVPAVKNGIAFASPIHVHFTSIRPQSSTPYSSISSGRQLRRSQKQQVGTRTNLNSLITSSSSSSQGDQHTLDHEMIDATHGAGISRRSTLQLLVSTAFALLGTNTASSANAAALLGLEETVDILKSISSNLTLDSEWYSLPYSDLRTALRSGTMSRLRVALRAVPELCASTAIDKAKGEQKKGIRALESADLLALRASRKPEAEQNEKDHDQVQRELTELKRAIDELLMILE